MAAFLGGLVLGLGLAYFLDRERGRLRRAWVRDRGSRLLRKAARTVDVTLRDLGHRVRGTSARARHLLRRGPVPDRVLVRRIRAEMGRWVSHPHAIEISATDGWVALNGPILSREVQGFVRRVKHLRGVRGVDNRLEVRTAADVPELQGGVVPLRLHRDPLRESWRPATRLVVGTAGLLLCSLGARSRDRRGYAAGTLGAVLLWSAITNASARRRADRRPPAALPLLPEESERAMSPVADG